MGGSRSPGRSDRTGSGSGVFEKPAVPTLRSGTRDIVGCPSFSMDLALQAHASDGKFMYRQRCVHLLYQRFRRSSVEIRGSSLMFPKKEWERPRSLAPKSRPLAKCLPMRIGVPRGSQSKGVA